MPQCCFSHSPPVLGPPSLEGSAHAQLEAARTYSPAVGRASSIRCEPRRRLQASKPRISRPQGRGSCALATPCHSVPPCALDNVLGAHVRPQKGPQKASLVQVPVVDLTAFGDASIIRDIEGEVLELAATSLQDMGVLACSAASVPATGKAASVSVFEVFDGGMCQLAACFESEPDSICSAAPSARAPQTSIWPERTQLPPRRRSTAGAVFRRVSPAGIATGSAGESGVRVRGGGAPRSNSASALAQAPRSSSRREG